ncbi:protein disulfide-isomerase-like protein of the testis [Pyxicephalus adspersus]|uniref:protein disulfide-isomerase-like protein of the testis n=1 Tax=Pyxicephalus adspersus TaxID=30357 RepID=UPI003B58FA67
MYFLFSFKCPARMKTLLLLLWCFLSLPALIIAEEQKVGKGPKAKKHKAPKIKEEDNVLILTGSNFSGALKENRYLLVKFYIALSAPSQAVKEEFSIAAGQLKKAKSEVKFGQVDITQEKNLGKEFKIKEFPTFKLFIDGDRKEPIDCKAVRTAAAFVTWINRRIGASYVLLNSTEQYEEFLQSDTVSVVGFYKDLNSSLARHFTEAAKDAPEIPFGFVGNEDILSHVGITGNMVAVYKKDKPVRYLISEEEIKSKLDLIRSIRIYIMDVVTEYNLETSVSIFDVPVNNHILLFASKTSKDFNIMYEVYESAALEFRGQIIFILVDTDESRNGRLFEYFRITEVDTPAVRILNLTSDMKYRMPADDVTFENVRNFCQWYLDGKVKPQKNSEEIPKYWDKHPVKVLVGKNFNKVAFNKSSNAFVMFYAPWNKESQELLPVWEDLGRRYMNNTNVTIAKIDCTANDIQLMVLDRYPYFRFFPAGLDNQSVRYKGNKTIEAFTEFLENELRSSITKEEDSSGSEQSSSEDDAKKIKEEL